MYGETETVQCFCGECSRETPHYRINPALRICKECANEIHAPEVRPKAERTKTGGPGMGKHLRHEQKADIRRLAADGVPVDELAKTYSRSPWTIRWICKGVKIPDRRRLENRGYPKHIWPIDDIRPAKGTEAFTKKRLSEPLDGNTMRTLIREETRRAISDFFSGLLRLKAG